MSQDTPAHRAPPDPDTPSGTGRPPEPGTPGTPAAPGRPPEPGRPPHPAGSPLTALVHRMRRAGLDPTAEELADALWLARHVPATPPPGARPGTPPAPDGADEDTADTADPADPVRDSAPDAVLPAVLRRATSPRSPVALYGPGRPAPGGGAPPGAVMRRIRVPVPAALPDAAALERSLRPLQRYRPPQRPLRRELDETATADRAADTGLVLPVLTTRRSREARLALVMDDSTSNVVWRDALEELRRISERSGAFREVTVHHVHESGPPPTGVGDPTGRRLTVVLSDCAGPLWRSGRMQRLLHTWAATAPVAVVQPLPQRMWPRTHLPAFPGVLRRREGPAGRLEFTPDEGTAAPRGIPVPVLALRRSSFEAWTRLVAGGTGQTLHAAAGIVLRRHRPAATRTRTAHRLDPAERVRRFRRTASPAAAQLAVHLSAVPLLLPVMQLVQRATLKRSGPDVLAEILLSGLLRRDPAGPGTGDGGPAYVFLDGVREELLGRLGTGSAALVLKHCSEYVESRYGRTVRNFPAMAAAFLTGSVDPDPRPPAPPGPDEEPAALSFAQVSTQVLRRLGADRAAVLPGGLPREGTASLRARARACLAHYAEHGTVRDLDAAIALLHAAAQTERDPTARAGLYEELAAALLRRWLVRPLPEDLPEALDAAQNAIAGGPPRAHLTLARVLESMADEVVSERLPTKLVPEWAWLQAGDDPEPVAAVLLTAADSSLAELTDPAPGDWDGGLREQAATARIRVLRRLAVLAAPYGLAGPTDPGDWFTATLDTAIGVVQVLTEETVPEALTELRTDERHESALLARGGLLLELARHHRGEGPVAPRTVDVAAARAYAESAGHDLHTGIDGIDWDAVGPAELCRVWLDYADAIEFADEHPDDDTRLRILQALDQARRNAAGDEEAQAHILLRMAALLEQRYLTTGGWAHRDSAIAAWTEALPLLPWSDPRRTAVLAALGRQLTERGVDKEHPADIHAAVRALRGAIEETAAADPELPRRRALLGHAHIERFRADGAVADLHEAEWALGAAAREAADPELAAYAWWYRAVACALLARRTGSPARLRAAVAHYRRAEEGPDGLLESAITAQWARAGRLEHTAGPDRALEEHRAVLGLLSSVRSRSAELIRQEVERLERR
ncbi:SAV_2336 N-terminal domain-related protein [Streptomyces yaizuensis]|uniref:Metallophosphoesterase n=1 Tax=Streptomyces yaizuensis TaxID=2989713 RepID=A0ABQ5NWP7_9ACTN|nr:SAV_2336 N-terminal domain-related protein [Streptomyces sp. YSPA8]GLF94610.1 metallophosphoesterase [Streptomyces sp. YSPA8]